MTSNYELARAMKNALESSGDLIQLRVELEDEALEAVTLSQSQTFMSDSVDPTCRTTKPALPPEIILVNELILQYLSFAGFHLTSNVLCAECGLPRQLVSEDNIRSKIRKRFSCNKPVLCSMIL